MSVRVQVPPEVQKIRVRNRAKAVFLALIFFSFSFFSFSVLNYFVYILYSEKWDRYYIGYSEDPEKRLNTKHNMGYVRATKNCRPYILKKKKEFAGEKEAMAEERKLKKMKSRQYLEKIIEGNW
jgi:putative endonuclease